MKTCLGLTHVGSRHPLIFESEWLESVHQVAKKKMFYLRLGAWIAAILLFISMPLAMTPAALLGFILLFTMTFATPVLLLHARDAKKEYRRLSAALQANEVLLFQGYLLSDYIHERNRKFFENIGIEADPTRELEICCLEESGVIVSVNGLLPKTLLRVPIGVLGVAQPRASHGFPNLISELTVDSPVPTRILSDTEINEIQRLIDSAKWYRPLWEPLVLLYFSAQFISTLTRPPSVTKAIVACAFGILALFFFYRLARRVRFFYEV
ncbi:MAG: hypothetical protein KF784_14020 [Fimbriimonadaceae bacterium]|nr:hypothetical protein [Fimbriimonadaceae bacterium]